MILCQRCNSTITTDNSIAHLYYVCRSCGFSNGSMGRTDGGSSAGCKGWAGYDQQIAEWKDHCGGGGNIAMLKDNTKPVITFCTDCEYNIDCYRVVFINPFERKELTFCNNGKRSE